MARLIDADAIGIGKCKPDVFDDKGYAKGWNSVIEILQNAPTVDAVPVVRCDSCVYHVDCGYHYCNKWGTNCPDDSDFFCAYGERDGGDE